MNFTLLGNVIGQAWCCLNVELPLPLDKLYQIRTIRLPRPKFTSVETEILISSKNNLTFLPTSTWHFDKLS